MLMEYQISFTDYLRDPAGNGPPAGTDPVRMAVYADLLYNKIDDNLASCCPMTHKVLGEQRWERLVRRFIAGHRCHTPCFPELPGEFADWLARNGGPEDGPPFLVDLVHYEWVELALAIAPATVDHDVRIDPEGDLMTAPIAFAPTLHLLEFHYPVHRLDPEQPFLPVERTSLLAYRDVQDTVRFIVVNAATAHLIALLREHHNRAAAALRQIAVELVHFDPDVVHSGGRTILAGLHRAGAILGVWREEEMTC